MCTFLRQSSSLLRSSVSSSFSWSILRCIYKPSAVASLQGQPQTKIQTSNFHTSGVDYGKLKKRKTWYRMYKRQPALTKLKPDVEPRITARKAFGGGQKLKALRVNSGMFALRSQDVEFNVPIKEVVWNQCNPDYTLKQIMVKGTVVAVDASPFKSSLASDQNLETLDPRFVQMLEEGKLLAKITTRPGQVGACDGDILEGEELENFYKQSTEAHAS